MNKPNGFTLLELMVVVAIIGVLASVALPQYQVYIHRSETTEALNMAAHVKEKVTAYYQRHRAFPADNQAAGVAPADKLIGNRTTAVDVVDGAIHVSIGFKASQPLQGKVLTFRPAVVEGSPTSPIAWLCGYDEPVPGMAAIGDNRTSVAVEFLPGDCHKPVLSRP